MLAIGFVRRAPLTAVAAENLFFHTAAECTTPGTAALALAFLGFRARWVTVIATPFFTTSLIVTAPFMVGSTFLAAAEDLALDACRALMAAAGFAGPFMSSAPAAA